MHEIDIEVRCANRYCEVLLDDGVRTECTVENVFTRVLLTLFATVIVKNVCIDFHPPAITMISLHAQGYDPLPALAFDYPDCAIVERITCALTHGSSLPHINATLFITGYPIFSLLSDDSLLDYAKVGSDLPQECRSGLIWASAIDRQNSNDQPLQPGEQEK